jgi:hypothetical protein
MYNPPKNAGPFVWPWQAVNISATIVKTRIAATNQNRGQRCRRNILLQPLKHANNDLILIIIKYYILKI